MNAVNTLCVLCGQGGRRRHGVAAVGCNDLLISLKAPETPVLVNNSESSQGMFTYAPPELSDPAIAKTRGTIFFDRLLRSTVKN
jgi:hypothetical protein